jgi:hypothetical protein
MTDDFPEIAAWGLQRIADMSREDLIRALNQSHRSYMAIARLQMSPSEVPQMTWGMEQADARFREIAAGGLTRMRHGQDK